MIITRDEFKHVFWAKTEFKDFAALCKDDHPLWIPESDIPTPCTHFVCLPNPLYEREYWLWCTDTLAGYVRCFSSKESEEWWGFTNEKDIPLWLLKWT